MESFFGHLKDDLEYKTCMTLLELRTKVDDYIAYYNSERYQWALKKMTPDEFEAAEKPVLLKVTRAPQIMNSGVTY
ncbi:IS3 family transposase [Paenibacillus etheri]|uniref:IS3 family transposase n=1 Tax=Paenibacillus etheri TaxID=1306852 RepID=UPI000A69592F|nr:IS3 family transposase [Paenibacillus etheri]